MVVKITFWLKGTELGTFPCIEMSNQDDRNKIAEANGIVNYDAFVLDDGRVVGFVVNGIFVTHINLKNHGNNEKNARQI